MTETTAGAGVVAVQEQQASHRAAGGAGHAGRRRTRSWRARWAPDRRRAASGDAAAAEPTGRRRARREAAAPDAQAQPVPQVPQSPQELVPDRQGEGRGAGGEGPAPPSRPRSLPRITVVQGPCPRGPLSAAAAPSEGSVVTAAEGAQGGGGRPQRGQTVPPQGVPAERRCRCPRADSRHDRARDPLALPAVAPATGQGQSAGGAQAPQTGRRARRRWRPRRTGPSRAGRAHRVRTPARRGRPDAAHGRCSGCLAAGAP